MRGASCIIRSPTAFECSRPTRSRTSCAVTRMISLWSPRLFARSGQPRRPQCAGREKASNPCDDVKGFPERKRERFLSPEEIERLGAALHEAERTGAESRFAVAAFRLLLLTGCRLREIQTLKWSYIDFKAGRFRLPDSKTGPKTVYMGDAVVELLRKLPEVDGNPYVIVGKLEGRHLTDLQHPWRRIRKTAGLDDVRIHDLRHTYASDGVLAGEGLPMIGKLLGHTPVRTTRSGKRRRGSRDGWLRRWGDGRQNVPCPPRQDRQIAHSDEAAHTTVVPLQIMLIGHVATSAVRQTEDFSTRQLAR